MSFSRELKEKAAKAWEDGYNHPFVQEIGRGTLDREKFKFYLIQDYHYLLQYAKVFALATVKADTETLMLMLTNVQKSVLDEISLHKQYMERYGVSGEEISEIAPSLFNRTYTANMLAVGQTGDIAEILATVFPCAWTYSDYGKRLKRQYAQGLAENFYKTWIENYAGTAFEESFAWFYDTLDELVAGKTDAQREKIERIFISSVEFEYLFWDMAYKQEMSYQLYR